MTQHKTSRIGPLPTKAVAAGIAILLLVLVMLYVQGTVGAHKVQPGLVPHPPSTQATRHTATVQRRIVDDIVDWPGTLRSRSVASIAPKAMAQVLEVRVSAGALVKQGDVLAVLDDRELRSKVEQARSAQAAAEAQATQAEADLRRTSTLFQKQASTQQDLDAAQSRAKAGRAQVAQARDGLAELQLMLGDTTLRAPFDGVVAERLADPGDMASPGKTLLVLHDPQTLRLEADVGEQCAAKLHIGQEVPVRLESLQRDILGRVEVIAPAADAQSRTFLIKAALPAQTDLRSGIFGTLRVACDSHDALLIPVAAVRHLGQLENVRLLVDGVTHSRHIRSGKTYGTQVEVLSGLHEGDTVVLEDE